jgi:aminomethyltransferase
MTQREQKRLLETPFFARTSNACETAEWGAWKAWRVVRCYTTVEREYFAIRNACGLFDLSPLTKYRISGPDGLAFLDRLLTRRMDAFEPGRVRYAVWCNDEGQVLDDGTVFALGGDRWRLCSQERHLDWLLWSAEGCDVDIEEETEAVAALALQGPTSCRVLKAAGLSGIAELRPFHHAVFDMRGVQVLVSRTGFTGDLGYELWLDPADALQAWDLLAEAGRLYGLLPVGSRALDMTRIEAGFVQAGVDFVPAGQAVRPGRSRSPFELGMERLVDLGKPVFNGRAALLAERERGPRYRLAYLDIDGNKPAHDSYIYGGGKPVGAVTSAIWSPSAKSNIAIASLRMPWGRAADRLHAEIYYHRELEWRRVQAACRVVQPPFFAPPRRNLTPALDC